MVSILQGFLLVLWKNLVIRRRHWLLTLFEVLVPVLLFLVYALAKGQMPAIPKEVTSNAVYFDLDSLAPNPKLRSTILLYAPNTTFTYTIMRQVQQRVNAKGLVAFNSEKAMLDHYLQTKLGSELREPVFGVVFEGSEVQFQYKIRCSEGTWQTDRLFPIISFPGPMGSSDVYFNDGFMALQNALDGSFMSHVSNSSDQFECCLMTYLSSLPAESPLRLLKLTKEESICRSEMITSDPGTSTSLPAPKNKCCYCGKTFTKSFTARHHEKFNCAKNPFRIFVQVHLP